MIVYEIDRLPKKIIEEFKSLSAATCYEAMGRTGAMDSEIKPVTPRTKLVGPAFTLWLPTGDNLMEHKAMTMVKPGDVLVIHSEGGSRHGATWGALANVQGIAMGYAGVVTDGTVRDIAEIRESKFPCFARTITVLGTSKASLGSINITITCGGVLVNPGDIIIGDDDGVVVVPKESAAEVLKKAKEREAKESGIRELLKQGKTIYEIAGYEKVLAKMNTK